jgi:hypothetical protein
VNEVKALPHYYLKVTEDSITFSNGEDLVIVTISIEAGLNTPFAQGGEKSRLSHGGQACILVVTSDLELIDFRRIS